MTRFSDSIDTIHISQDRDLTLVLIMTQDSGQIHAISLESSPAIYALDTNHLKSILASEISHPWSLFWELGILSARYVMELIQKVLVCITDHVPAAHIDPLLQQGVELDRFDAVQIAFGWG